MLRKTRIALAAVFYTIITLLFLDFTGTVHTWFGWMAKIQFLPAVLALNTGVIIALVLLTVVFGRIYCSVICPLGVLQDIFMKFGMMQKKNRFTYSPAKNWLRYGMLGIFVVALLAGFSGFASLLAPYSAYGRIAGNLLAPVWQWANNGLAYLAERADSYAFYETEVWLKSMPVLIVAVVTLVVVGVLAWRGGRTYCNTICPVGTVLGLVSRFSLFKMRIDTSKCVDCGRCAKNCKSACINVKEHKIDYSRCVTCMDCIGKCSKGAVKYVWAPGCCSAKKVEGGKDVDSSRRAFLSATAVVATTAVMRAQEKKVDGGLAAIGEKVAPKRKTPIVPPGALSARHFAQHCTACQLCVSACPNDVLRPSTDLERFMQPEMSFERGYCRPECTKCSEVCPTGAIKLITREDKSSTQVGHAVWRRCKCIPHTDGVQCGNCARHCPTGAIQMVPSVEGDKHSLRYPAINVERCIGCGACENLCPARPVSAIHVEGHERHKTV